MKNEIFCLLFVTGSMFCRVQVCDRLISQLDVADRTDLLSNIQVSRILSFELTSSSSYCYNMTIYLLVWIVFML